MSAVPQEAAAKTTNLAALRSTQAPEQHMPMVRTGFDNLQSWELMQRQCKALSASTLVPQQYQNSLPNCLIALEMAQRIGASPLMVMQNLYIVHGNPGWSAKFLIACINTCGRFSALRYEWRQKSPTDDEFGCRAWAIERETGERLNGVWVDWKMVKAEGWHSKNGSKWKTMPDQMFIYRAAAFWQRAYAPEISMGLNTTEEMGDIYDAAPTGDGQFRVTTDDLRTADAGAIDASTGEIVGAAGSGAEPPKLTIPDAKARIDQHTDEEVLTLYMDSLPDELKRDGELTKAYKARVDAIRKPAEKK